MALVDHVDCMVGCRTMVSTARLRYKRYVLYDYRKSPIQIIYTFDIPLRFVVVWYWAIYIMSFMMTSSWIYDHDIYNWLQISLAKSLLIQDVNWCITGLGLDQSYWYLADDILNAYIRMKIVAFLFKISLKFVPEGLTSTGSGDGPTPNRRWPMNTIHHMASISQSTLWHFTAMVWYMYSCPFVNNCLRKLGKYPLMSKKLWYFKCTE